MSTYTVSAKGDHLFEVCSVEADNDRDAILHAATIILHKGFHVEDATVTQLLWTYGEIDIRNSAGDLVKNYPPQPDPHYTIGSAS